MLVIVIAFGVKSFHVVFINDYTSGDELFLNLNMSNLDYNFE